MGERITDDLTVGVDQVKLKYRPRLCLDKP